MITFRHILAPVDFEPCSKRALEIAIDFALQFDSKLTLVHAWEVPGYLYASPYLTPDIWEALGEAAKQQLDAELTQARTRLPRAESVLTCGPAGFEVIATAERLKADLIVVGTHGRRGLSRAFLGSVAEKVVRGSSVPVLTVHGGDAP
jgi:nucleotide-binding universal stress UspA family protein